MKTSVYRFQEGFFDFYIESEVIGAPDIGEVKVTYWYSKDGFERLDIHQSGREVSHFVQQMGAYDRILEKAKEEIAKRTEEVA